MGYKSVPASKLPSGTQTPKKDEESFDSDYASPLFSAQLQERLRLLDVQNGGESSGKSHTGRSRLVHSIEVLSEDRRKTSELAREQALGTLLRHLVMKYDPDVINYDLFHTILQSFTTSRTEIEANTALQLICVAVTMLDGNEHARTEDCFDLVNQLHGSLLKRIDDSSPVAVRQTRVTAYAVLTYFLNAGGGGYGMEAVVSQLMELAESISNPDEAPIAAAALGGAALVATLTSRGSASEIADGWLFSLVPMLEVSQITARLAAVKFVAVIFELADPELLRNGENREACEDIVSALETISQESVARTAKRDKRMQNLLVKSVLKSCERTLAEPSEEDNVPSDAVSQYHKHTLTKSLGVTTWASLIVVEHLGWVFGPGIHAQLANNPYIRSLLDKEDVHVESSAPTEDDEQESGKLHSFHDSPAHKLDAAKRSKDLRKQQLTKAENQGIIE